MAKVTIRNGATVFEIENGDATTVGELVSELVAQNLLNIPAGATPMLDGEAADNDAPLYDGAEVAFGRATGQKGPKA
jgi:hypothetical protein